MQKRVGRKKRNSRRYKYTSSTSPVADRNLNSLPLVNEAGCTQCDRRGERSVFVSFFFFWPAISSFIHWKKEPPVIASHWNCSAFERNKSLTIFFYFSRNRLNNTFLIFKTTKILFIICIIAPGYKNRGRKDVASRKFFSSAVEKLSYSFKIYWSIENEGKKKKHCEWCKKKKSRSTCIADRSVQLSHIEMKFPCVGQDQTEHNTMA